jgi:magnesium-protoporphyrin IX monomethyl ester (oxidative) cyclase
MNLQLLKWSREYEIDAAWNMLCGIPGESDSWYAEMAEWLPAIFHLQPPTGVSRVRYDRFSPYQMRPGEFGLTLEPSRAYKYVYPLPMNSLMRLAYSFEDSRRPRHAHRGLTDEPGQRRLQEVVYEWNAVWRSSPAELQVSDDGASLRFFDTRPCAYRKTWSADGLEAELYRLCDSAQSPATLIHQLGARHGAELGMEDIQPAIESLLQSKALLSLNGKLLALGISGTGSGGR